MKPIKGYGGQYLACPSGRIWAKPSKKRPEGCYLRPWLIGKGYETVMLYKSKKGRKYLVHRLIAGAFVPSIKGAKEVNHKDGNRLNNRPENLEWCTSKQNKAHAWATGLYTHKGTGHYLAKLGEDKVRLIRRTPKKRGYIMNLSRQLGVSEASIRDVLKGVSWKHIT